MIRKIRDVGEFLTIGVTAEGDPGTAVVTLADLSAIEVTLDVGESEIRKVALGAIALVTPEAMPRQRYLADVIEIAAMADRQKGVVPVKVRIRAPDRSLLPEMSAKVSFLAERADRRDRGAARGARERGRRARRRARRVHGRRRIAPPPCP